jgi:hypothetical protein
MNDISFVKQYLVQCIAFAAGNLRLNSNQVEAVALLKELLLKSNNLENDLIRMKKVTELSTLAIKLYEIFSVISKTTVDILTISDKFKQHSRQLEKDVYLLLYNVAQTDFRTVLNKLKKDDFDEPEEKKIDEKLILEEDKKETASFTVFEETILKPIKPIDSFFKDILENGNLPENIDEFIEVMKKNSNLAKENGFEVLSGMHHIVFDSLNLIKEGTLKADKESIESLRACLIVIAAVIKGKEVNISDYVNKAESFSKKINLLKSKE